MYKLDDSDIRTLAMRLVFHRKGLIYDMEPNGEKMTDAMEERIRENLEHLREEPEWWKEEEENK